MEVCATCGKVFNEVEIAVGQCNSCDPFDDELENFDDFYEQP